MTMKMFCFEPSWRSAGAIRLYSEPDQKFFDRLEHGSARFSMLANGEIRWGDASIVLHHDIVQANDGLMSLMTGMVSMSNGYIPWCVHGMQFLLDGPSSETMMRSMLRSNVYWRATEKMFGSFRWSGIDPVDAVFET